MKTNLPAARRFRWPACWGKRGRKRRRSRRYTVETRDSRTLAGLIAAESAASLTLKMADGMSETILRRDIAQLSSSGFSLMPDGLETAVSTSQMADLMAFLLTPPQAGAAGGNDQFRRVR